MIIASAHLPRSHLWQDDKADRRRTLALPAPQFPTSPPFLLRSSPPRREEQWNNKLLIFMRVFPAEVRHRQDHAPVVKYWGSRSKATDSRAYSSSQSSSCLAQNTVHWVNYASAHRVPGTARTRSQKLRLKNVTQAIPSASSLTFWPLTDPSTQQSAGLLTRSLNPLPFQRPFRRPTSQGGGGQSA